MGAWMHPFGRHDIGSTCSRPSANQLLESTATQLRQRTAGRSRGLPVQIDWHTEFNSDTPTHSLRRFPGIFECKTYQWNEREHIECTHARVHTIMVPQIDVLERYLRARNNCVFDDFRRTD